MAQKRRPDQTKLIAEAALSLADNVGWERLTFKAIAGRAKISVKDVEAQFSDIWDILKWVLKRVDDETQDAVEKYLGNDWRDNLAEILMARFELAQAHRGAFASLRRAFVHHPEVAPRFVRGFYRSLNGALKLSGISKRLCQPVCVAGLGAVYLSLVDVWMKDTTRDLSKTMAAIDRRLDLYAQALDFVKR
jgi:AcrR family transcriptional regulator